MKFNIFDHMKKILISFGCLLLVGILVLSIFGLNLGQELRGNIQINVNIGRYNIIETQDIKAHTKKVTEVLKENGAKVIQTNLEDGSFDTVLVVTVKNHSKVRSENVEFANKLENCVKAHYNDELMVVTSRVVSPVMTNVDGVKLAATLLVSVIVTMIYLMFRIKLLNTICVLATTFGSFILFFDLVVLTRVSVNTSIFGVIALTVILSMILSAFKFASMVNARVEHLRREEVGKIEYKDLITKLLAMVVIGMLLLVIFGTSAVKGFALTVILSMVSVWVTNNLVGMPLCYYLNNYTVAKEKVVVKQDTEKTIEE